MKDSSEEMDVRDLEPGLYELLVTAGLQERLADMDARLLARHGLHRAEVSDRIALHPCVQIDRALAGVQEAQRVETGLLSPGRC